MTTLDLFPRPDNDHCELLKHYVDKVSSFKREIMWSAVRNFGAPYWENDDATKDAIRALRQ